MVGWTEDANPERPTITPGCAASFVSANDRVVADQRGATRYRERGSTRGLPCTVAANVKAFDGETSDLGSVGNRHVREYSPSRGVLDGGHVGGRVH